MHVTKLFAAGVMAVALSSSPAFAQAAIAPFTGVTFGGDTEDNKFVYGAVFGFGGNVGFDIDFGYAPNFFSDSEDDFGDLDGKLNITTLMFNIRIGGNPTRAGVAPFVSGGAGLMRGSVSSPSDLFDEVSRNDFALNVGGGLQGYFNEHVGLRGDIRYFRNLTDEGDDGFLLDPRDFDLGDFTYWRGTVGVSFRF
jgi:hypothetical protein